MKGYLCPDVPQHSAGKASVNTRHVLRIGKRHRQIPQLAMGAHAGDGGHPTPRLAGLVQVPGDELHVELLRLLAESRVQAAGRPRPAARRGHDLKERRQRRARVQRRQLPVVSRTK